MSSDQSLLELLLSGKSPRKVRLAAAKGLIPMPLLEQLKVLIRLTADPDKVVNAEANSALENIKEEQLLPVLRSEGAPPALLEYFCFDPNRGPEVLQAVAMNNSTPDKVICELAQAGDAPVLELILLNQTRLIRHPMILEALLGNPAVTSEISRRANEIKVEFFVKAGRATPQAQAAPAPFEVQPVIEASAPGEVPAETIEVEVPFRPEDLGLQTRHEISTFQRIARMNTSQKVKLALLGNREERAILVRDSNRVVASATLKSPKISDSEIEAISQMRNVPEEILRLIGNRREWIKSYVIIRNLVRNPKTPAALSLRLLPRILEGDMRLLARDKSIPEIVRRTAERTVQSKLLRR